MNSSSLSFSARRSTRALFALVYSSRSALSLLLCKPGLEYRPLFLYGASHSSVFFPPRVIGSSVLNSTLLDRLLDPIPRTMHTVPIMTNLLRSGNLGDNVCNDRSMPLSPSFLVFNPQTPHCSSGSGLQSACNNCGISPRSYGIDGDQASSK